MAETMEDFAVLEHRDTKADRITYIGRNAHGTYGVEVWTHGGTLITRSDTTKEVYETLKASGLFTPEKDPMSPYL